MTTKMKNEPCKFCGRVNERYIHPEFAAPGDVYGFNYVYCAGCGVAYLNPMPDDAALARHYAAGSAEAAPADVSRFKLAGFRRRMLRLAGLTKSDRVLEVGVGRGEAVYCLATEGHDVTGVDPHYSAQHNPAELNARIIRAPLEEAGFEDSRFTLVMLWSVLEHVRTPVETLREISRVTAPGGRLIISVPCFDTLQRRFLRRYWPGYGPPEHLFVYTRRGLTKLLRAHGFLPMAGAVDHSDNRWMMKNAVYRLLADRKGAAADPQVSRNFSKAQRAAIGAAAFAFTRIESLLGRSATANLVFRKQSRPD